MEEKKEEVKVEKVPSVLSLRFLTVMVILTIVWAAVGILCTVSIRTFMLFLHFGTVWHSGWAVGPFVFLSLTFIIMRCLKPLRLSERQLTVLYACITMASLMASIHMPVQLIGSQIRVRLDPFFAPRYAHFWPFFWSPAKEVLAPVMVGGVAVPWGAWAAPIAFWFIFVIVQFLFNSSNIILLRNRWIDTERVAFPFGVMAANAIKASSARTTLEERFHFKVLAASLAIGFIINLPWVLNVAFPGLPDLYGWRRDPWIGWHPGRLDLARVPGIGTVLIGPLAMNLFPLMMAVAYLCPMDILFGGLVFYLIFLVLWPQIAFMMGIYPAAMFGWYSTTRWMHLAGHPPLKLTAFLETGVLWGYVILWFILFARRYVVDVVKAVIKGPTPEEVEREPMPYRWALITFFASAIILIAMIVGSGAEAWSAILLLLVAWLYAVAWGRVRGELGFFITFYVAPSGQLYNLRPYYHVTGFKDMTQDFLTTSYMSQLFVGRTGTQSLHVAQVANILDSYKAASLTGTRTRDVFIGSAIGVAVAAIVGMIVMLHLSYSYGFYRLPMPMVSAWESGTADLGYSRPDIWAKRLLPPIHVEVLAGALLSAVLMFLRLKFIWWPFSPIALVVGAGSLAAYGSLGFMLVALIAKWLTIKIGGAKLYERYGVPVATGIALGTGLCMFIGMLIVAYLAFVPL